MVKNGCNLDPKGNLSRPLCFEVNKDITCEKRNEESKNPHMQTISRSSKVLMGYFTETMAEALFF